MANKIFIVSLLILGLVAGCGQVEVIDGKLRISPPENGCPVITCPGNVVLAYVNNCETGGTDKYICEDVAVSSNCLNTEEILSELG